MPTIPGYQAQVRPTSLRAQDTFIRAQASGDDFGAQIGQALQSAASGINSVAEAALEHQQRKSAELVANKVAQSDFTPREMATRNATPANGEGYYDNIGTQYDEFVENNANTIDDPVARREYKQRMYAEKRGVMARSATYQASLAATDAKTQTDASLASLTNRITSDPMSYDTLISQGVDVIESSTAVNQTLKEQSKVAWRQQSANARFTGMLERAKTVEDIDAISMELTGVGADPAGPDERRKNWQAEFRPEQYDQMLNTLGNARKAIQTKADADARAAIEGIEARSANVNVQIPQEELKATADIVKRSSNPVTIAKWARIYRDETIKREENGLPVSILQQRQNASNGNPGVAFPGIPAELSTDINDAATRFGVNASYLGATATREYGQFFGTKARGKPEYAPQGLGAHVDLSGVNREVVDAAAVAGELFGRPLSITSGYRSQGHQDAIRARGNPNRASVAKKSHHTDRNALDISTAGMSEAEKGKLAGALVDAGFTGIGEYGTHMHADFRAAVPESFGKDGTAWGGWTYLSPGVMDALKQRGYAANLSSDAIMRSVPAGEKIDWGRGTQMTKDDGRPASSAVGVFQIVDSTFLEIMRNPKNTAIMGIDVSAMSDAQVLELRKDRRINTMAGAAYAAQNKRTLEGTLGRSVNDAELYMAHFLGPGGAIALINANEQRPDQSAAALLPNAAAANRQVFYRNGKELTVAEVYGNVTRTLANAPSSVAFGDNQTRQRIIDQTKKALSTDPMRHAQETGTFNITSLEDPAGFAARGAEARAVADYYDIPTSDIKPFTEDEANSLVKTMKDGTVDDVLQVMAQIQQMGGDVTRGALKQIDQKDSVYAYAAGLFAEREQMSVASDIVRGQKRIQDNPAIKDTLGVQNRDINDAFVKATGGALYEVDPRQRQAIQDAAFAHYIETSVARNSALAFDQDAFGASVQAVLGGAQGAPSLDEVNGETTVMPPGVTGAEMEDAFTRMTVADWSRMSDQQTPPMYVNGTIIDPRDLADEATLRAIGGGKYKVMLGDGSFAVTGRQGPNGRLEAFVFIPTADDIDEIVARPVAEEVTGQIEDRGSIVDSDGKLTVDEQQRIRENFGSLYNFDEYGRWLGPAK